MAINTTATLSVDSSFTQQDTTTDSLTSRNGSLGYSQSLTSGTGSLNVDAVLDLQDYSISSGSQLYVDFKSASQPVLGSSVTLDFSNLKSIAIYNKSTTVGEDIFVRATGSNALTEPFNGGSGNIAIKPSASYIYSDPYTGVTIDSSNKNLQLANGGTGTIDVTLIAVGVTG
tara:strand:- start:3424 stop:3939 length:516 start_codon:yes stop_codon:yes gene_type:complete